jgi:hypothetical protein
MDQDAFRTLQSILNEAEDLVGHHVARVQDNLVVGVDPKIGQVHDANWLPMVGHLPATTIDDASDFIGNDELQVLRSQLVPDKEAILDFHRTQNFVAQAWP